VAGDAAKFAAKFDAASLGRWLGLLHDIGKYNPDFQKYLEDAHEGKQRRGPPHAVWGAALIYHWLKPQFSGKQLTPWQELTPPLAGHHGGLKPPGLLDQELGQLSVREVQKYFAHFQALSPPNPTFKNHDSPLKRELFVRMLLSALVDADHTDTARHFNPEQFEAEKPRSVEELWSVFQEEQKAFLKSAGESKINLAVTRVRREVHKACLERAEQPQGVFRLTVPTGGGKTRSGLAFALKHATVHKLERVIVAIPYTSIIEQTAEVYRDIFSELGSNIVLEHHSQVQPSEGESQDPSRIQKRLATQNWNAPLIVTTTVQLFESLFSNRPSKVRKLHNVAKSVIILDEVQTLPPGLLKPTLDVLRQLVEEYGVTLVLSTATQPAFDSTQQLREELGALHIREIAEGHEEHFRVLERVTYSVLPEKIGWADLAEEVKREPQVIVILNRRRDALDLLKAIGEGHGALHMSTLLCGAHRRSVLAEVRKRLDPDNLQDICLISTQVVEAGVDLDFPVVYRAVAPLDRIVQAAGRCNREGRRPKEDSRVVIFEPQEGGSPQDPYKSGLEKASFLLRNRDLKELQTTALYREYFERWFNDLNLDKKRIQALREQLNFPEVATAYRLIDEDTASVIVPYDDWETPLKAWRAQPNRSTWQNLQPYLVNIYCREAEALEKGGILELISENLYVWNGDFSRGYHEDYGFIAVFDDPNDLIVYDPSRLSV
jgi:CRISPR-associated endonuclease/helicase Cas3